MTAKEHCVDKPEPKINYILKYYKDMIGDENFKADKKIQEKYYT